MTLSIHADRELEPDAAAAIEHHLRECAACRHTVASMRQLTFLGRSALTAIIVPEGPVPVPKAGLSLGRRVLLAAAAAVAVALSLWSWHVATPPTNNHEAVSSISPAVFAPPSIFSDEAFEEWAAPYQAREIPLVPMDRITQYTSNDPDLLKQPNI